MSATLHHKKFKVDMESKTFKSEWTEKYLERFGQAQCLNCLKTVAVFKEFNVHHHWKRVHRTSKFDLMSASEKKNTIAKLTGNIEKSSLMFHKQTSVHEKVTPASYEVSLLLAQRMKPFSDGDFIKECLMTVVNSVCPEQRSVLENMSLSSRTIHHRVEEMSDNVQDSVKSDCLTFVAYSLALDGSPGMKDTVQLAIFIRDVTAALKVHEEFLQIVPLHDTTTAQYIFNAILQCVEHHSLDHSQFCFTLYFAVHADHCVFCSFNFADTGVIDSLCISDPLAHVHFRKLPCNFYNQTCSILTVYEDPGHKKIQSVVRSCTRPRQDKKSFYCDSYTPATCEKQCREDMCNLENGNLWETYLLTGGAEGITINMISYKTNWILLYFCTAIIYFHI